MARKAASCTAGALHIAKLASAKCASYGAGALHKSLTMKHCFRLHFITPRQAAKAPQYEASPFHSDMKHFAYAPYDLSSIALCATDDEKMENESFSVCHATLPTFPEGNGNFFPLS